MGLGQHSQCGPGVPEFSLRLPATKVPSGLDKGPQLQTAICCSVTLPRVWHKLAGFPGSEALRGPGKLRTSYSGKSPSSYHLITCDRALLMSHQAAQTSTFRSRLSSGLSLPPQNLNFLHPWAPPQHTHAHTYIHNCFVSVVTYFNDKKKNVLKFKANVLSLSRSSDKL